MSSIPEALKTRRKRANINVSRFSYKRAFSDGPRNFEPLSSDDDHTRADIPSPKYHATPTGGHLSSRQIKRASCPYTMGL
ncbi:hypothetical protein TNCV_369061 [Trichonephila clavipes]|nr:hypothetical protein TNCV_369061 [Trichonephila clavipes]